MEQQASPILALFVPLTDIYNLHYGVIYLPCTHQRTVATTLLSLVKLVLITDFYNPHS